MPAPVTLYAKTFVSQPPVGCTVLGAPWSRDRRGNVGADGRRDRLYPCFLRRACLASAAQRIRSRGRSPRTIFYGRTNVILSPTPGGRGSPPLRGIRISPTLHQPLSHGALRRDSSPFRGAEAWADVCGVCAFVYHDADTVVFLPPVRGGVLDAPWLRDCRGWLDASVRPDRQHPRHPRCAILTPTTQRIQSRGHSPRTIGAAVRRRRPPARASTTQKGPVLGPVLFALKCPWAFHA